MANFFDKISEKTKNVTDGMGYKSKLKQTENELTSIYEQIGHQYYNLNKDNVPEDMQALFTRASELNYNVEYYKQMILDTKGVKICPLCNKEIAIASRFCPECGGNIVDTVTEEASESADAVSGATKICPKCNSSVAETDMFCENCGNKF